MENSVPQKLCKVCNCWKSADEFPLNGTLKCLVCKRAEYHQSHRKPEIYHADLVTNTKKCKVCKETKDLSEFHRAKESSDGYRPRCKACNKIRLPKEVIPEDMKKCSACTQILPATLEYFYANRSTFDGLGFYCKNCDYPQKKRSDVKPGCKRCSVCKEQFPATTTFFHSRKSRAKYSQRENRLISWCKNCRHKYDLQHIEDRREYQRHYERRNAQRRKLRRLENLERHREYGRKSYRKNGYKYKQHRKEYRKTYVRSHRLQYIMYKNKRRARKRAVEGTITEQQIQQKLRLQRYRCYYGACGYAKFERVRENGKWKYLYHLEHTVPLSRAESGPRHDVSYIVLACPSCNHSKGTKLPHEWEQGGRLL